MEGMEEKLCKTVVTGTCGILSDATQVLDLGKIIDKCTKWKRGFRLSGRFSVKTEVYLCHAWFAQIGDGLLHRHEKGTIKTDTTL